MSSTPPDKSKRVSRNSAAQAHPARGSSDGSPSAPAPVQVRSTIHAVTIYADCAFVTRRATIRLNPGLHLIEIRGLPADVDPSTLGVVVLGAVHPRLVSTSATPANADTATLVRSLEAQLEAIQGQLDRLDASIGVLRADRQALRSLVSGVVGKSGASAKTATGEIYALDTLTEQAEQINTRLQQAIVERHNLDRDLRRQHLKLESVPGRSEPEGYSIRTQVEIARPGDLILDISYMMPKASWEPFYELHFIETGEQPVLRILYAAHIRQNTGEDWRDVEITLSNGKPALSNAFVEPEPWYISTAPVSAKSAGGSADISSQEQLLGAPSFATVISGGSGPETRMHLSKTWSVASSGNIQTAQILDFSIEPEVSYIAAPRRSPRVHRKLRAANTTVQPLLSGRADLYQDETCIGTRILSHINPGDTFEIFLGVEERITVASQLLRNAEERKPLNTRLRMSCACQIQLTNNLHRSTKLTLYDQIPFSRDEGLAVKLIAADPEPADQNPLGTLVWELVLDPNTARAVRFAFSIEHPPDTQVVGLG